MKKFLLSLMAAGTMALSVSASQAVTFQITVDPVPTNWSTPPGITTTNTLYTTLFTPAAPFDVTPTSNLGFGFANQFATPGGSSGTFAYDSGHPASDMSSLINFDVADLANLALPEHFRVEGTITGGITDTSATAQYTASALCDITAATCSTSTFVITGNTYLGINTTVNGNAVFIGILQSALLAAPSNLGGNSVQGIITAPQGVPEPGTLGMLLGTGVSGSLFLLRRRRAS